MERALMTVPPLAFLAHLQLSGLLLSRRHISLDGRPAIRPELFYGGKYLVILVWLAAALASWGVGLPAPARAPLLHGLSVGVWLSGFAFLTLGRIGLGRHMRLGIPREGTALRTGGLFRLSRNPMYLGLDATVVGAALYTRNPAVLALAGFIAFVHHRIILAEESWLLGTFGPAYERYRRQVRRYL